MKEVSKEGFWKGSGEKTMEKLINIVMNGFLQGTTNWVDVLCMPAAEKVCKAWEFICGFF